MRKTLSIILALCLLATLLTAFTGAIAEEKTTITIAIGAAEAPTEEETKELYYFAKYITDTYPNAEIAWELNSTHDDHRTKIKLQAQSNSMPDMFWESMENIPELIEMGVLAPIDEAVEGITFVNGALDNMTFNGHVYGMAYKNDVMGFFYNKALVKSVGYDTLPTDWDGFLACVKALKDAGITPIAHGATDVWDVWAYNMFFQRYGFNEYKEAFLNGEIKWAETEALVKPFERILELNAAGAYPENVTTQGNDYAINLFLSGEAAMYNVGSWALGSIMDSDIAADIDFSWGPSFPDGIEDQKIGLKEYTNAYWFSAKAMADETKKAILTDAIRNFYSESYTNGVMVEDAQLMPAVPYTGNGEGISDLLKLMLERVADEYAADIQICVGIPDSSFQQPFWNAITSCITGYMTAQEAAESMDEWYATK